MKVQQLIDFLKQCNPENEVRFQFVDEYDEYTDFYITEVRKFGLNRDEQFVKIVFE